MKVKDQLPDIIRLSHKFKSGSLVFRADSPLMRSAKKHRESRRVSVAVTDEDKDSKSLSKGTDGSDSPHSQRKAPTRRQSSSSQTQARRQSSSSQVPSRRTSLAPQARRPSNQLELMTTQKDGIAASVSSTALDALLPFSSVLNTDVNISGVFVFDGASSGATTPELEKPFFDFNEVPKVPPNRLDKLNV
jgi:hypothetical protein